jgi:hypothetical protein
MVSGIRSTAAGIWHDLLRIHYCRRVHELRTNVAILARPLPSGSDGDER